MAKKIFKYKLTPYLVNDDGIAFAVLEVVKDFTVSHVGMSGGNISIWAFVDVESPPEDKQFLIVPTGGEVPEHGKYLGTVHQNVFVWHIFQET